MWKPMETTRDVELRDVSRHWAHKYLPHPHDINHITRINNVARGRITLITSRSACASEAARASNLLKRWSTRQSHYIINVIKLCRVCTASIPTVMFLSFLRFCFTLSAGNKWFKNRRNRISNDWKGTTETNVFVIMSKHYIFWPYYNYYVYNISY